jgi:hypothetical protein
MVMLETVTRMIQEMTYPVGSIYLNASDSTNPGTLLGFGTWEAFGAGRVMVGKASSGTFATGGATGGAEAHDHYHVSPIGDDSGNPVVLQIENSYMDYGTSTYTSLDIQTMTRSSNISTSSAGVERHLVTSSDSSSLQPYIVVYAWKRTA